MFHKLFELSGPTQQSLSRSDQRQSVATPDL